MALTGFPTRVHYISHDKVAAAFVKGARIIEDDALIVIANRGMQRGSEMHDQTNHVFIIVDALSSLRVGPPQRIDFDSIVVSKAAI